MSTDTLFQLFPLLDPATEAALRSSIQKHGVLVPVAHDQHGRILDGYHRSRIADELGVPYEVIVHEIRDDDHGRELARTLNAIRRHLDPDQRRALVAELRTAGHSLRAIGGALGVSHPTVLADLESTGKSLPVEQPDRIVGRDGRSRPARRAEQAVADAPDLSPHLDLVETAISEATEEADEDYWDDAANAAVDQVHEYVRTELDNEPTPTPPIERTGPPVTKPDLGGGISHPARYSLELIPIFQAAVPVDLYPRVLDPFAGTGRIHELANETVGVEIEPEWAAIHPGTVVGSALDLDFDDESFDAVVTSPTYGNRFADSHNASDPESRRSYTHDLGHALHPDNSGAMHWGPKYREFHEQAWEEAWRVLRPGGRMVLNIKDHIRKKALQRVTQWHMETLLNLGFEWRHGHTIETPNLRQGENAGLREPEQVLVFDKPEGAR
jgi:ParB-like chromosome segregation protein Spo0J/SAM-dependent methyltransferase